MDSDFKKVFQKASYEPESRLSSDIWHAIKARENRVYKIKTWGYSSLGILSLVLFIPSVKNLVVQFGSQGFYEYVSLVFSDFGTIITYWKEFSLSIINSLPLVSITISFFLLFVLFHSIRKVAFQFKSKLLLA